MDAKSIKNLVVVSDTHCGCRMGLCPPTRIPLDDGGEYYASQLQRKVWKLWLHFCRVWVPKVTHGQPFAVLFNGDTLDGNHHDSTTQISHNLVDQSNIARLALRPLLEKAAKVFFVRGTEAHVGKSGVEEERIAKLCGAIPNRHGQYARHDAWIQLGKGLIHAVHPIGTSGSAAYESTAIMKELAEAYVEAGRNRIRPPDCIARSHRHRNLEIRVPTKLGYGIAFVTAGWQLKTPFAYKISGGRNTTPQIGGSVIIQGDEDLYTRHWVKYMNRSETVTI